jgi:hypothetical protein
MHVCLRMLGGDTGAKGKLEITFLMAAHCSVFWLSDGFMIFSSLPLSF